MSTYFPHVDILALKKFAAAAAAGEQAYRLNRNAIMEPPPSTAKKKGKKAQERKPPYPVVTRLEDTPYAGEQVELSSLSLPFTPTKLVRVDDPDHV